jgi:hypothetical protein
MKSVILLLLIVCIIAPQIWAQTPIPVDGWPYKTRCIEFGNWIPRLNLEEGRMHLYFTAKTGEVDKFELDGSFSTGWPLQYDSTTWRDTPIILDIDHDGLNEMLCSGWGGGDGQGPFSFYLFDDNGALMSGFPVYLGLNNYCVADLDGDNEYEIIAHDFDNDMIYCIDRFGNPKPGWPLSIELIHYPNAYTGGPSVGDLDLDGKNEVLFSTSRYIYAFRYDGTMQEGFPIQLQADTAFGYFSDGPSLVDVDHDGYTEIVTEAVENNLTYFNSMIIIYEHDGTLKEGWPKYLNGKYIWSAIIPSDINGDGQIDLIFDTDSLNAIDLNGNPLPGWPAPTPESPEGYGSIVYGDFAVLDIDGDGDQEIFFDHNAFYPDSMGQDSLWYYGHSYQFGVDHLGQSLTGFPMRIKGMSAGHPPTMGLEPNSSHIYLSVASMFFLPTIGADTLFVELFRFPDSTGAPNQWPMVSHDNLMTRNYNFVDNVTSIANDIPPPLPKSVVLKQNYPNPFNPQTTISYSLPKASLVTIDIYDLLGRKLETLFDGKKDAGSYSIIWDASERSSGIYFCRIKAGEISINRKMALLK